MDPETILQLAHQYSEREDYARALEEYGKLLSLNPADTRVLLRVGDLQVRIQNLGGAIHTYDQAASLYASQGHGLKAVAVYKQVRELVLVQEQHESGWADRFHHVVQRLTSLYLELGLTNDALRSLDDEATRLRNLERDEDSLRLYRQMTDLAPNVPLPYLRLGEGLFRVGQTDEALAAFWSATQLLLASARHDDALRVIERMLHIKPLPRHAKIAARLYLEKGTEPEGKQALSRLQICFQADPTDIETLQMLSQAFAQIGQDDRAIEVQKEIARLAYEQGRPSVFDEAVGILRDAAPDDEQVQALVQMAPPPDRQSRSASGLPPAAAARSRFPGGSVAPESLAPASTPPSEMLEGASMPPSSVPLSLIPMSVAASSVAPPPPSATRHSPPPKPHSEPSSSRPPRAVTHAPPPKPARGSSLPPEAPPSPVAARGTPPPLPRKFKTSKPPPLPASFFEQGASGRPTLEGPPDEARGSKPIRSDAATAFPPPGPDAAAPQGNEDGRLAGKTVAPDAIAHEEESFARGVGYEAILERSHRALTDARAFRGLSLFHKAIETIQTALEADPRSIELREMLRDLFTDVGDRDGAIEEMLTMAEIYVEFERPDHARSVLQNILDEEPMSVEAREMLEALDRESFLGTPAARAVQEVPNYEPYGGQVSGGQLGSSQLGSNQPSAAFANEGQPSDAPRQSAPLGDSVPVDRLSVPMTLLESIAPPTVASGELQALGAQPADEGSSSNVPAITASKEPTAGASSEPSAAQSRPPIPPPPPSGRSAGVNPPLSTRGFAAPGLPEGLNVPPPPPSSSRAAAPVPPPSGSSKPSLPPPPSISAPPPTQVAAPPPPMSLDETLEEVEFFATRGMLAEAERLLVGQLERYPEHPLLLESLADVRDALADSKRGEDPSAKLDAAQRPKSSDSMDWDLQASLGELGRAVRESLLPPEPGKPASNVDVDGMFERFKTSVKQQVPDADSKTHYDLGIAYKDLSLLDDAVEELNLASRDPDYECRCQALIGTIYAEQSVWDKAAKAYSRALSAVRKSKAEETSLYYELGHVSEMLGQSDQAIYYFRQVLRRDQGYRDARDRVQELRTRRHRTASGRPRGADEEVDRAFEDILGD